MSSAPLFSSRTDAGKQLLKSIESELAQLDAVGVSVQPILYALPRGGIPVAAPIAQALGCPLDIIVAKKITRPQNPELAIGACTPSGHVLWLSSKSFRKSQQNQQDELWHQTQEKAQAMLAEFSPFRPQVSPEGAIAILVDDGIATGMTMAVAALALRAQNPAQVWICAPVAPLELIEWLQQWADRVIVLQTPHPFLSVSRFYVEFPQVETSVALAYLQQHNQPHLSPQPAPDDSNGE